MPDPTPRQRFGFLVHDVSRMRRTFFDQALAPVGITRAQWWALGNISRHSEDGMIQTHLAAVLEVGKVSVGGLIDRLEDADLVYREIDKEDRRVKRIFVTHKGQELLDHMKDVGAKLDAMILANVSEHEIGATAEVLARIKMNIREAIKGPMPEVSPLPSGVAPTVQRKAQIGALHTRNKGGRRTAS